MRPAALAIVGAIAFAGAPPAHAAVSTSCESRSWYDPKGPEEGTLDIEQAPGSCASSINGDLAALNGDGEAGLGYFLSRSEATLLEGPTPFQTAVDDAYTVTTAQFGDTITVSSEGLAGEPAIVHATAFLSGVVDIVGNAQAVVRLDVQANGTSQLLLETCNSSFFPACFGSAEPYPRIVSEVIDADFGVVLGQATSFGLSLTTGAAHGGSLTNEAGSALADFSGGGEVSWGGIESVDHAGTPIAFTVSSESGTDWTRPVPEPEAGAEAVAAVLALAAGVRRRRNGPQ